MRKKIKNRIRRFILSLVGADLQIQAQSVAKDTVLRHLTAIQAIDVGFREAGKLVLIARVDGRDIVKIIDTKPAMTRREWQEMIGEMDARFGARLLHQDLPIGYPAFYRKSIHGKEEEGYL